jgi:hypothetical protein
MIMKKRKISKDVERRQMFARMVAAIGLNEAKRTMNMCGLADYDVEDREVNYWEMFLSDVQGVTDDSLH